MMKKTLSIGFVTAATILCGTSSAKADQAIVPVGNPNQIPQQQQQRFADPPERNNDNRRADDDLVARDPELKRSPVRFQLGPSGITAGKSMGLGVGVGADFGTGSVGGRLYASWLRGEGTNSDGTSTPTGDSVGIYGGEITLDLHKRGPLHPIIGMGGALVRVSRPDTSGYAGAGTGRLALEYSLGFDDADVRVGGSVTGGLVGPVDSDVKDLRAYALFGAHLAIGF